MSHFSVLVTGENIEEQLRPFCEDICMISDTTCLELDKWGYLHNPNSKWDWFTIGGRWRDWLKLKPGTQGIKNDKGLKGFPMYDQFAMAAARAMDLYEEVAALFDDGVIPRIEHTWVSLPFDERQKIYHSQAGVIKFKEKTKDVPKLRWLFPDEFQCTLEEYAHRDGKAACRTFALLHDGVWYEEGKMLMFGASNKTNESIQSYEETFNKIMTSLPADTMVTVVDCNI